MELQAEHVHFLANGAEGQGYLARPQAPGPHRGVLVIQEWWGLDSHIKDVADRFARAGYVALAPDLYHGAVAHEPDDARRLAMELEFPQAIAEMVGAAAYLAGRAEVEPKRLATIGFCMGGSLALLLAAHAPQIGAVASFYGGRPIPADVVQRISAPVLGIYGENDAGIPAERRAEIDAQLSASGVPHELHVYTGAGHAFFNDARAHGYHPAAAQDAWARALAWFDQYLT